jgi:hypothetical protein
MPRRIRISAEQARLQQFATLNLESGELMRPPGESIAVTNNSSAVTPPLPPRPQPAKSARGTKATSTKSLRFYGREGGNRRVAPVSMAFSTPAEGAPGPSPLGTGERESSSRAAHPLRKGGIPRTSTVLFSLFCLFLLKFSKM